jgi:hypothetical protein
MSRAKSTSGARPPSDPDADLRPVPEGIRKALKVFVAEFPELLKRHYRKWVACDATGVLFVGDSQEVLYKKCLAKGLGPDQFVVDYMLPGAFDDLDMDSLRDPA